MPQQVRNDAGAVGLKWRQWKKCWYTRKYNIIYTHKKSIAFPLQISTKLTNARHYFQIPCTKFHPKDIINVECTCVKKLTTLSRVWLSQQWFSWNLLLLSIFCGCILIRILSKLYKKFIKYGQHSIHALMQGILSLSWFVWSTCLLDKFY